MVKIKQSELFLQNILDDQSSLKLTSTSGCNDNLRYISLQIIERGAADIFINITHGKFTEYQSAYTRQCVYVIQGLQPKNDPRHMAGLMALHFRTLYVI
jgi:hypothetical protein